MLHVYHLDMLLVQWNEGNIVLTNYLNIFQKDEFASSTCDLDLIYICSQIIPHFVIASNDFQNW